MSRRSPISWFVQRITGFALIILLGYHVYIMHMAGNGPIDFKAVQGRISGHIGWQVYYYVFLLMTLFHGLNGVYGVLLDWDPKPGIRKLACAGLWLAGVAASAWGFWALQKYM
jgi:succinate dehydrogenase / fumarate reductase membrane anchor subunit